MEYDGWCPAGGWAEDYHCAPGLLADYPGLREFRRCRGLAVRSGLGYELTLNVAGPRESEQPGIYARARVVVGALLRRVEQVGAVESA